MSAKWNTKQSESKPLDFFDILFMISDDQIKNLHEQDIYDHQQNCVLHKSGPLYKAE